MTRRHDPTNVSGWDTYSTSLIRALRARGIEVESTSDWLRGLKIKPYASVPGAILFDFFLVPFVIRKGFRGTIFHAVYPQQSLAFPLLPRSRRTIVTIHDTLAFHGNRYNVVSSVRSTYGKVALLTALKSTSHIIVNSSQTKGDLIAEFDAPPEKITITPLGVDKCFAYERLRSHQVFTIGYLGVLDVRKRVDLLLAAYSRLLEMRPVYIKRSRLQICGAGPDANRLQRIAKAQRIPNVEFKGHIPQRDVPSTYAGFTVMYFPSLHEGFGLPILEAQRCGTPVIVASDSHIPEEVRRCAITCSDIDEVAITLARLNEDQSMWHLFSERGARYASQFTWERCAAATLHAYELCQQA